MWCEAPGASEMGQVGHCFMNITSFNSQTISWNMCSSLPAFREEDIKTWMG